MKFGETPSAIRETESKKDIGKNQFFEHEKGKKEIYLKSILKNIENPETKELLLDSSESGNIQSVIYGIKPVCFLNNKEDSDLLKNIFDRSGDIIVTGEVLFNKHLVIEVVRNNPDYFAEDIDLDAEKIVDKYVSYQNDVNSTPDKVPNIQIGLLLGYPKRACEDYQRFRNAKSLLNMQLEGLIPQNTPDWELLSQLQQKERDFINSTWENNGEHPMHPAEIYDQAKYLFYKYLPKNIAGLSWENYQGKAIKIGGVYWMEWDSNAEGEKIKQKYKKILEDPEFEIVVEEELDKMCGELVNEDVRKTLDENNIIEIKNLTKELREDHAKIYRERRHYRYFLQKNENPLNGRAINSADDLIQYLKMQKEVYKKEGENW